ncbi:Fc receptor-like protein 2 isoform X1 [Centroberyx affinis]|uniref:Fc receptor-like protein 2 isoform X1 n=1 Tax=Centroberyx affinis TaxID=166261 RepID=UPI003A5C1096
MEFTPVCLLLSCLHVSPDSSQLFRYDSVSLSCSDRLNSTGWRVRRNTSDGGVRLCSSGWGVASSVSACTIRNAYPSDSGVYWCESREGERSNSVSITVTDHAVILESPVRPVIEGDAVTLRCQTQTTPSNLPADFYKDGFLIGTGSAGEMTIHSVSKSDEGLYKCQTHLGESPESWLAVQTKFLVLSPSPTPTPTPTSSPAPLLSLPRLMCHLVVGIPYLLTTIILGLIYRDKRKRAQSHAEQRGNNDVIMEIAI